jgi:Uma2 family endonuclease
MSAQAAMPVTVPAVPLTETDGEPLESAWHRAQINLLIDVVTYWFRDRDDYYVDGNMFIYFSEQQVRDRDYRGPDFFYVAGVSRKPLRPYWAVWQEGGRYPDVIIELLSPTTADEDRTTKKVLYERTFRTPEYVCYDPHEPKLEGWRLGGRRRYRAITPDARGWLWLEELELWLGSWSGEYQGAEEVWLRFYDAEGRLVPTRAETAEAELERLKTQLGEREAPQA